MNWHDEKITSTGFVSQMKNDDGYEIHFYTDKREAYLAVQEVCRQFVYRKPLRNADRIRSMTDEELAEFMCHNVSNGTVNCAFCAVEEFCHMGNNGWIDWLKQEASND